MKTFSRTLAIAAVLSLGLLPARAQADPITLAANSATTFDILWSEVHSGVNLTALAAFDVTVTNSYVQFLITVTNNTSLFNERVHGLGFNTDPNGTSLTNTVTGEYFGNFALNRNFPSFQRIDVCAWTDQNCTGGSQGSNLPGLGTDDTFGFRLNGNFSSGVTLDTFAIKFQGDLGSFEFEGDQPPPPPTTSVPEPASLLFMGIGLSGAFALRRRKF